MPSLAGAAASQVRANVQLNSGDFGQLVVLMPFATDAPNPFSFSIFNWFSFCFLFLVVAVAKYKCEICVCFIF